MKNMLLAKYRNNLLNATKTTCSCAYFVLHSCWNQRNPQDSGHHIYFPALISSSIHDGLNETRMILGFTVRIVRVFLGLIASFSRLCIGQKYPRPILENILRCPLAGTSRLDQSLN
ncbi:MAG: hypothetical protein AB7D06_00110 [Pedobacter sp.]